LDRAAREACLHQARGEWLAAAAGALDPELRRALNRHVAQGRTPGLLVQAGDGAGRAIAAWLAARRARADEWLFVHHVGAGSGSRSERGLLRRLLASLAAAERLNEPLPLGVAEQRERLSNWLARAAAGRRVLIVITALDALDAPDAAAVLDWLPTYLPAGVRVVIGAASDATRLVAGARGFACRHADGTADLAAVETALATQPPALLCALWASRDGLSDAALAALGLPAPAAAGVQRVGDRHQLMGAEAQDWVWRRLIGSQSAAEGWHRRLAEATPAESVVERVWQWVRVGDLAALRACLFDPTQIDAWLARTEAEERLEAWQALGGPDAVAEAAATVVGWSPAALLGLVRALRAAGATTAAMDGLCGRLQAAVEHLGAVERLQARLELLTLGQDPDTGAVSATRRAALATLLDACVEQLGADAELSRRARHALAMACEEGAALAQALTLYREALGLREGGQGQRAEARALLPHLLNLAAALKADNRLDEARALLQRALGLVERQCGPAHPLTATVLDSLAGVVYAGHDLAAAEDLYRRALAVTERAFGPEHPATAAGLHNLATVLDSRDRHLAAEPLLRRALAIRRAALGERDADTAATVHNLAGVLTALGRPAQAEPLLREARATWEALLGAEHPATAATVNNLADLLRDRGAWDEAEALYRQLLGVWTRLLGEGHRHAIMTRAELAGLYLDRAAAGDAERAAALLEDTLDPARALGAADTTHLDAVIRLAAAWRGLGRHDDARALLARSLREAEALAGLLSPAVQRLRRHLEALEAAAGGGGRGAGAAPRGGAGNGH
jgi:tetratricopeptide (TPR) repeat protein